MKPKTTSPGKGKVPDGTVPILINFPSMTVAHAKARMVKEMPRLRMIHAHKFTGLVNELVRRWGNGEVKL